VAGGSVDQAALPDPVRADGGSRRPAVERPASWAAAKTYEVDAESKIVLLRGP